VTKLLPPLKLPRVFWKHPSACSHSPPLPSASPYKQSKPEKEKTTVNMGVAEKIKEIEEEMKRTQ